MEEELGCPIAEVFSSISERPIAAASLGQARPPAPLRPVQVSGEQISEYLKRREQGALLGFVAFASELSHATAWRLGVMRGLYGQRACREYNVSCGKVQVQVSFQRPMRVLLHVK
jgi:hypothetical protein